MTQCSHRTSSEYVQWFVSSTSTNDKLLERDKSDRRAERLQYRSPKDVIVNSPTR